MKRLKTIFLICAMLCLCASCKKDLDMTLLKSTLLSGMDFSSIRASEAFEIKVVKDENSFVEMECSAYLNEYIICKVENGCLDLSVNKVGNLPVGTVYRAVVHTPTLHSIMLTEASKMYLIGDFEDFESAEINEASVCSGGVFSGNMVQVSLNETSQLVDFTFDGQQFNANLDAESRFVGNVNAMNSMEIHLASASSFVNYGGNTESAKLELREASLLNMAQTEIRDLEVDFGGASSATVMVNETISGRLNELSTLYYYGNPQINVECSEGSLIKRL